ncbi:MMPL family transporter [Nocardiopsis listeri]|uniref:MMPL family transporter n=1 Tax=Nocardiopsis listeri TaxID=53440 RepID=UPI00082FDA4C|nr:MMPL family transporter [Nocardiopsis listeri]
MALLLHRLGRLAARRAKTVIASWFALLLLAFAAVAGFGGQLTTEISLPELETLEVADRVDEEFPDSELAGGSADVVVRTTNEAPFTAEQESALRQLMERLEDHEPVTTVADPFATETDIAAGYDEIDTAREELDSARAEIDTAREETEPAREQIEGAQEDLDEAIEQARDDGTHEAAAAEFEQRQEELDQALTELEAAEQDLEQAEREHTEGGAELKRAEAMLELVEDAALVSDNGDTAIITLRFDGELDGVAPERLDELTDTLTEADIDGVEFLTGEELSVQEAHLMSIVEVIGLVVATVVLFVMLGTFIGVGLPLLNALLGVGVGVLLTVSASAFVDMMAITPTLGLMLGLAVGIDYALFILHRHRTQLKQGMSVADSIPLANGTAGNAVMFAGATVIIALLALNVTSLPFLGMMGTAGAFCVAIAVLMAITMTPALLSLVGPRILARRERRALEEVWHETVAGEAPARETAIDRPMSTPKAIGVVVLSLVGLAVLAVPTLDLRLGLPDNSAQPEDTAPYQAYHATAEAFGAGWNGPFLAVADLPGGLGDEAAEQYRIDIAEELGRHSGIVSVMPVALNDENTVAAFQIIPVDGPTAESTEALVHEFRDGDPLEGTRLDDAELSVAGWPAANIDISDIIADALPLYLVLVIALSLVLMIMVFRSLLLPVIATLGFIGSFAGAMGVVVAVYQWGWFGGLFPFGDPGPVLTFMPVLAVGVLFGLAMDYQLFTASGMREAYARGSDPRLAVRQGLRAGRSVVVAAALIMASIFAGFAFSPDPMSAPLGLGLTVGVLIDAFVVRLLLVPALLHLCGPAAWYLPKWLDRILPDVDVEGAALERPQAPRALDGPAERVGAGRP